MKLNKKGMIGFMMLAFSSMAVAQMNAQNCIQSINAQIAGYASANHLGNNSFVIYGFSPNQCTSFCNTILNDLQSGKNVAGSDTNLKNCNNCSTAIYTLTNNKSGPNGCVVR